MATEYFVSVRIGLYAFTRQFDTDADALECFDSLSEDKGEAIEGNWLTRETNVPVDSITIRRQLTPTTIGDPGRQ